MALSYLCVCLFYCNPSTDVPSTFLGFCPVSLCALPYLRVRVLSLTPSGPPVCHIAVPYSYWWDMKLTPACLSPATFWYLVALSGSRDSDQTICQRKVISSSSDRLWSSPNLIFNWCRGHFPWGWSGRGVKLAFHLHVLPRLRMLGSIPPFSIWRNGV